MPGCRSERDRRARRVAVDPVWSCGDHVAVSGSSPPSPGCAACASRDVVIAELVAANARLVERVTALERAAGRNSGNSGMPPSTDDLPGGRCRRRGGRRARGVIGASRRARRAVRCRGWPSLMSTCRTARRAAAGAVRTWPGRRRCGWSARTSPTTCPRSRSWCGSTTSTGSAAGAGASMSGRCPGRCRPRRRVTGSTSSRWWCTCWSTSTSRSRGVSSWSPISPAAPARRPDSCTACSTAPRTPSTRSST